MNGLQGGNEELLAKSWLATAVQSAGMADAELWSHDVSERARVAAVFYALRHLVDSSSHEWSVDCEYNRAGASAPKPGAPSAAGSLERGRVLGTPDIVVHRRGLSGPANNLMVVEFKTTYQNLRSCSRDIEKVEFWKLEFGYQLGAVVGFGPHRTVFDPKVRWLNKDGWSRMHAL